MTPRVYSSEGVVLSRKKLGEADRLITIFSKDFGKLPLIAKGVRKPSSRKRGHLEVFSQIKFTASRGKDLDILVEAEVINNFTILRKNLNKVAVSYYLVEIINRSVDQGEPHVEVYNLLVFYLNKLVHDSKLKEVRLEFAVKILEILGFWPRGITLDDPDKKIEEVIEKKLGSIRVGKKLVA